MPLYSLLVLVICDKRLKEKTYINHGHNMLLVIDLVSSSQCFSVGRNGYRGSVLLHFLFDSVNGWLATKKAD